MRNVTVTWDDGVVVSGEFDGGNCARVERVAEDEVHVWPRPDAMGRSSCRSWFHFSVRGVARGRVLRFAVRHINRQTSLFKSNHRMSVLSRGEWRHIDGVVEHVAEPFPPPTEVAPVVGGGLGGTDEEDEEAEGGRAGSAAGGACYGRVNWSHRFEEDGGVAEFAFCFPYSYEHLQSVLDGLERSTASSKVVYFARELLVRSPGGRRVELLTITERSPPLGDASEVPREMVVEGPVECAVEGVEGGERVVERPTEVSASSAAGPTAPLPPWKRKVGKGASGASAAPAVAVVPVVVPASVRTPSVYDRTSVQEELLRHRVLCESRLAKAGRRGTGVKELSTDADDAPTSSSSSCSSSSTGASSSVLFPERGVRPERFADRPVVFVSARVHPGETPASHTLQGMLDLLTDETDRRAQVLRRNFTFCIVPMLNPDGVSEGNFRTDLEGTNLNRVYLSPDPARHPAVFAARSLATHWAAQGRLFLYLDLHAHVASRGAFFYGNAVPSALAQLENLLFPRLAALHCPWIDISASIFDARLMEAVDKGGASRQGSGRVGIHKATGLARCYTLECSYNMPRSFGNVPASEDPDCASPLAPLPHFRPCHYHHVGRACLEGLLESVGLHPSSRVPASEHRSLEGFRVAVLRKMSIVPEYMSACRALRGSPALRLVDIAIRRSFHAPTASAVPETENPSTTTTTTSSSSPSPASASSPPRSPSGPPPAKATLRAASPRPQRLGAKQLSSQAIVQARALVRARTVVPRDHRQRGID